MKYLYAAILLITLAGGAGAQTTSQEMRYLQEKAEAMQRENLRRDLQEQRDHMDRMVRDSQFAIEQFNNRVLQAPVAPRPEWLGPPASTYKPYKW
jgi:hypothetical protein